MERGKGNLEDWKAQTTADEIMRVRDQSTESQAGRLLEFTAEGINRRCTMVEAPHLKRWRDVADYLGTEWAWMNQVRVHHEVYAMISGKTRQVARDDFGTILSADLREKRDQEKTSLWDRILGKGKE